MSWATGPTEACVALGLQTRGDPREILRGGKSTVRQTPLGQRCRACPRSFGAVGTFADLGTLESLQSLGPSFRVEPVFLL